MGAGEEGEGAGWAVHGDGAGECGFEFDADAVGFDGSAAELHIWHDDVEDVFFDEFFEEADAVCVFSASDGEGCVFVDGAEVVGVFDWVDWFFEPLAASGSELGFECECGVEVEAGVAVDIDGDVGSDGFSDGLDAFESGFGAVGESGRCEGCSALVEGGALDRCEAVVDGFNGHLGEVVGTAVDGSLVVGEEGAVDVSVESDFGWEIAVVFVGVSEVVGERHRGALGEGVGDGASEGADGGGESLVDFQLCWINAEELHGVVVGCDALTSESVCESGGVGCDGAGELGGGDFALAGDAVGVGEVDGGPVGAAAGVDLLELERGGGPPDFGGCCEHSGILDGGCALTLTLSRQTGEGQLVCGNSSIPCVDLGYVGRFETCPYLFRVSYVARR